MFFIAKCINAQFQLIFAIARESTKRPKLVFGPNCPSEMLENTGWTFCLKILKKKKTDVVDPVSLRDIWNFKKIKICDKTKHIRSKLGRTLVCAASEVKLLRRDLYHVYEAANCAVSPYLILLGPHGGEIWTKSCGPKCTQFFFDKKATFLSVLQSVDDILQDVSVANCLMVNY